MRENSQRDAVPDGCLFGHGYKKGRFGTDPYDILFNHETYAPRKFNELCKDGVTYGCLFGHGYKEGSVWNRPLRYFSQPQDVGIAILYKIFDTLRKDADVFTLAFWERVRVRA